MSARRRSLGQRPERRVAARGSSAVGQRPPRSSRPAAQQLPRPGAVAARPRRSAAVGSTVSSTACTSVPNAAPAGRSRHRRRAASPRPSASGAVPAPAGAGLVVVLASTSGSLPTPRAVVAGRRGQRAVGGPPPAGVEAAVEPGRGQAGRRRSRRRRTAGPRPARPARPPTSADASRATATARVGVVRARRTGTAACAAVPVGRTAAGAAARPGCCAVGAHQAMTCDWARVSATYSSRRSSPTSSAWCRPAASVRVRAARAADVEHRAGRSSSWKQQQVRLGRRTGPSANGRKTTGNSGPCCVCTVRTCTAAASESSRRLRSGWRRRPASAIRWRSHSSERGQAELPVDRGRVQRLPTWRRSVSCRSPPTCAEQPRRQAGLAVTASSSAATPRSARSRGPVRSRRAELVEVAVRAPRRVAGGVPADEAGQRGGRDPGAAVRLLRAPQQGQPVPRGRGAEHAGGCRPARRARRPRAAPRCTSALCRWVAPGRRRPRRPAAGRRRAVAPAPSSAATVAARSAATSRRAGRPRSGRARSARSPLAGQHPQPERGAAGTPASRRSGWAAATGAHDDPVVAERGAAEARVCERRPAAGVAAPVGAEGAPGWSAVAGGREVG